ncbi:hypothetical protein Asi03nite_02390 [Actinoplanes siamensis]|uniref:Uncharacterized protein n=2 Tax=Actinoplanes siamensis TaxID=1223317 RepID=A0A919KBU2_9ACTN|nr:hypothetical protein Asi03nite_02390 [Actinoplanes siamensis]
MLALLLFTAVLLVSVIVAVWPDTEPAQEASGAEPDRPGPDSAAQPPTTLEGAMAAQLLHGEITVQRYRHTLELLAARDDEEYPLAAPEKGDFSAGP